MANILYDNCFNTTYRTSVKEIKEENGMYWHLFEETIFYPENGGMPADEGLINQRPVLALKKEGMQVWHLLAEKMEGNVELTLDFHRRFKNAQNHTAQHLISGIVESVYGCNTTSHHVHDDYCDIEFDREILNERQLNELRVIVNGLIRDDLPVKIFYPTNQEVKYFTSKDVSGFEEVRIVSIGKISIDPCACIHVPSLRYLQAIAILGVEKSAKGMKIKYVCGDQLLIAFTKYYEELNKAGTLLAQPMEYVEFGILKLLQDNKNLSADNTVLKQKYLELVLASLPKEGKVYHVFEDMDLKTFGIACKQFKKMFQGDFIFVCKNGERMQIYVSAQDAKAYFEPLKEAFCLQGGGNSSSAQGGGIYDASIDAYVLKLFSQNEK